MMSLVDGLCLLLGPTLIFGNAVIVLIADADEEGRVKIFLLACFLRYSKLERQAVSPARGIELLGVFQTLIVSSI